MNGDFCSSPIGLVHEINLPTAFQVGDFAKDILGSIDVILFTTTTKFLPYTIQESLWILRPKITSFALITILHRIPIIEIGGGFVEGNHRGQRKFH